MHVMWFVACAREGSSHLAGPLWGTQRILEEQQQGRSRTLHTGGAGSDCEQQNEKHGSDNEHSDVRICHLSRMMFEQGAKWTEHVFWKACSRWSIVIGCSRITAPRVLTTTRVCTCLIVEFSDVDFQVLLTQQQ